MTGWVNGMKKTEWESNEENEEKEEEVERAFGFI